MGRISQHILFWILFWLWSSAIVEWHNLLTNCGTTVFYHLLYTGRRLPIIMASTYFLIYYIVPKLLFEKKSPPLFGLAFLLLFLFTNLVDRTFVAAIDGFSMGCSSSFWSTFFHADATIRNGLILIAILGTATMIKFFKLILKEQERNNLLQLENLQTKHAFLKSQVNPHFLFNALNNIYSMSVQSKQEKISENISNLSGIMKYLTYDSGKKLVPLEKEIQLIRDYIDIQKLRIDETDDVTIAFNIEGTSKGKKIAPVILLPLVENCFKHGVKLGEKCLIKIHLKVTNERIIFTTKNYAFASNQSEPVEENGIGLSNVKKRLEMEYLDNHQLKSSEEQPWFIVQLQLNKI